MPDKSWIGFPKICVPCDIQTYSGPSCEQKESKNCLCKDIKTWQNFTTCSQPEKVQGDYPKTQP